MHNVSFDKEAKQIIKELINSDTDSIMSITPEITSLEYTMLDVEAAAKQLSICGMLNWEHYFNLQRIKMTVFVNMTDLIALAVFGIVILFAIFLWTFITIADKIGEVRQKHARRKTNKT